MGISAVLTFLTCVTCSLNHYIRLVRPWPRKKGTKKKQWTYPVQIHWQHRSQCAPFARKLCLGPASCGARRNEFSDGTLRGKKMDPVSGPSWCPLPPLTSHRCSVSGVLGALRLESTRYSQVGENVSGKSSRLHRILDWKKGTQRNG